MEDSAGAVQQSAAGHHNAQTTTVFNGPVHVTPILLPAPGVSSPDEVLARPPARLGTEPSIEFTDYQVCGRLVLQKLCTAEAVSQYGVAVGMVNRLHEGNAIPCAATLRRALFGVIAVLDAQAASIFTDTPAKEHVEKFRGAFAELASYHEIGLADVISLRALIQRLEAELAYLSGLLPL